MSYFLFSFSVCLSRFLCLSFAIFIVESIESYNSFALLRTCTSLLAKTYNTFSMLNKTYFGCFEMWEIILYLSIFVWVFFFHIQKYKAH